MRTTFTVLALSLLAQACAGCSTFKSPAAEVTGVSVTEVTDEGMTLSFTLVLTNPNEEPLELDELHYELTVDGHTAYTGRRSAQATLAAGGTRELRVPAVARFAAPPTSTPPHAHADRAASGRGRGGGVDVGGRSFQFSLRGRLGYLTPDRLSRILRDLHLRRPKVRFEADGVVDPPAG